MNRNIYLAVCKEFDSSQNAITIAVVGAFSSSEDAYAAFKREVPWTGLDGEGVRCHTCSNGVHRVHEIEVGKWMPNVFV